MQADHFFSVQQIAIFTLQQLRMLLLHDEDNIRPANMACRYANSGAGVSPGRSHLVTLGFLVDFFCSQTPPLIVAAYEQDLFSIAVVASHFVAISRSVAPRLSHSSSD